MNSNNKKTDNSKELKEKWEQYSKSDNKSEKLKVTPPVIVPKKKKGK